MEKCGIKDFKDTFGGILQQNENESSICSESSDNEYTGIQSCGKSSSEKFNQRNDSEISSAQDYESQVSLQEKYDKEVEENEQEEERYSFCNSDHQMALNKDEENQSDHIILKRNALNKDKFIITDCSLNDDCKSCQSVSETYEISFMEKCKVFPPQV